MSWRIRAKVHNWMQQWGYKQLLVIDQSLFSSKPFVGSYSYFCAPSGIIKNKQKIETYEGFLKNLYYDCQTLSQAFPFLNMTISVTQFHKSLINFFIENGNVRVDFGNKEYFYEYQFKKETTSNQIEEFSTLLSPDLIKMLYLL